MSIEIYLNGIRESVGEETTISGLINVKKVKPELIVVELDEEIIEKDKYPTTTLKPNCRVEFIQFMGGG